MTDQLTPPKSDDSPPLSRGAKAKSEIMAGGAVTENLTDEELAGGWRGALSMLAIVALFAWLAVVNFWIFVFVVGVVISIFLHELGHYLTARWTGMKVTQFFLFFGPRLWSFRRGETEYGVRALPLGAFVRIVGMNRMDEVDPGDEARSYRQKSFPRRLLVISAGSIMHMIIGFILLTGYIAAEGTTPEQPLAGTEVTGLSLNGPASVAGLLPGDVVVSIDGATFFGSEQFGELVRSNGPTDVVTVNVVRDGNPLDIEVALGASPEGNALLGVTSQNLRVDQSVVSAAGLAIKEIPGIGRESVVGVVKVLNPVNIVTHLTGQNDDLSSRPTTVIGAAQVSGQADENGGLTFVLILLASLNIFIGVFNMFPLLPLDGGHAAVAAYERVREAMRGGKQRYFADVERLMPLAMGVVILLLSLFAAGLYLDVTSPIKL